MMAFELLSKRLLDNLKQFPRTDKMPVLFLGHGSPMNAIADNQFTQGFQQIAKKIPTPTAILCISAHWETNGSYLTAMERPRTIHDFYGFPQALFDVSYPASGSPLLAKSAQLMLEQGGLPSHLDDSEWGLDHGTWSVLVHLFPKADVPVVQLSLDRNKGPAEHYQLATLLKELRQRGVLIVGSGNIVHNLRMIRRADNENYGFDWALAANEKVSQLILERNHQPLIDYEKLGSEMQLSVPTPEHYLPLLYSLALQDNNDDIFIFNSQPVLGSLTMTSVAIGV